MKNALFNGYSSNERSYLGHQRVPTRQLRLPADIYEALRRFAVGNTELNRDGIVDLLKPYGFTVDCSSDGMLRFTDDFNNGIEYRLSGNLHGYAWDFNVYGPGFVVFMNEYNMMRKLANIVAEVEYFWDIYKHDEKEMIETIDAEVESHDFKRVSTSNDYDDDGEMEIIYMRPYIIRNEIDERITITLYKNGNKPTVEYNLFFQ